MSWRRLFFLLFTMGVWSSSSGVIAAERQTTITPKTESNASLLQVVVPGAWCAAVNDDLGILVVGHNAMNDQHLSVYRLGPTGNLAATPPVRLSLPRPDSLKAYLHYPVSMAFHPKLPILYVWQDIQGPALGAKLEDNPVFKEFSHLLIYSVTNGALQLVQSHGRGTDYMYSNPACACTFGSISLDTEGKRIFLPNLKSPPSVAVTTAAVGYYRLDAQGMPIKAANQITPILELAGTPCSFPCGMGFVAGGNDAVLLGFTSGLATWDLNNRRARFSLFVYSGLDGYHMITSHPKLPYVYVAEVSSPYCYRMEHVDGYMTLLPQVVGIVGANFTSPPVFMARQNKLAVGSVNGIFLLALDSLGHFAGTAEQTSVASPSLKAIAYSEKFDHLYMAVEDAK